LHNAALLQVNPIGDDSNDPSRSPVGRGPRQQKSREGEPLRLFQGASGARRLLSLQLENFVFDTELLALQIVYRVMVRQRPMDFFIEGSFERRVLFPERLDAILHRHAVSSC
jgi:hypothetical protein